MDLETIGNFASNPAISALLGALVGGFFTRNAPFKAHSLSTRTAKIDRLTSTKSTLALLKLEIEAAWSVYHTEYAPELMALPEEAPYITSFEIGRDTFVIYDSMPECLIEIAPDVAGEVVQLFMRIKGLVAMIEKNNQYSELCSQAGLQKLDQIILTQLKNNAEITPETAEAHEKYLRAWTDFHAIKMGMGAHAYAMRTFTSELDRMVASALSGLAREIRKIDAEVFRLEANLFRRLLTKFRI